MGVLSLEVVPEGGFFLRGVRAPHSPHRPHQRITEPQRTKTRLRRLSPTSATSMSFYIHLGCPKQGCDLCPRCLCLACLRARGRACACVWFVRARLSFCVCVWAPFCALG